MKKKRVEIALRVARLVERMLVVHAGERGSGRSTAASQDSKRARPADAAAAAGDVGAARWDGVAGGGGGNAGDERSARVF